MTSFTEHRHKAVRDRIPDILRDSGRDFAVKEISDPEFLLELERKLDEELAEYLESKEAEELADLLEVIYRIAELRGFSKEALESVRLKKRKESGGFEKNLILLNMADENRLCRGPPATSKEFPPTAVFRPEFRGNREIWGPYEDLHNQNRLHECCCPLSGNGVWACGRIRSRKK